MTDDPQFALDDERVPLLGDEGLSVGQRRTAKQRYQLAHGIHPATKRRLLEPAGPKCGTCVHHVAMSAGNKDHLHKCRKHTLGTSASEASDIRVGWPACVLYQPETTDA